MKIFEPHSINKKLALKNRLVAAAVETGYSDDDGYVNSRHLDHYSRLANGGVGLIVVEATAVNPDQRTRINLLSLRISNDKFISGLKELSDEIHAVEHTKVLLQLVDCLRHTYRRPRDLEVDEILNIQDLFIKATERAMKAGFDGVEYHCAHSYTMTDFLSKRSNKRKDDYGGSIEKRAKIVVDTVKGAREKVGTNFIIGCRINGDDFVVGGNTLVDSKVIAKILEEAGVDFLDISAGGRIEDATRSGYSWLRMCPDENFAPAPNAYLAEEIKKVVDVPVIHAGKIDYPDIAEKVLQEGKADLIAMARPLLSDPDFPNKAKENRWDEIVRCKYCKNCEILVAKQLPVFCINWDNNRKEKVKNPLSSPYRCLRNKC